MDSVMTECPELWIRVIDDEILISLPFSTYTATYYKPADLPRLTLKHLSEDKDPRASLSRAKFLGCAWKAANTKARALEWIV